jgi:VanZ family protein
VLLFARRQAQWRAAAGLVLMGIVLEFAQSLLTQTRMGDFADALANTSGVVLGQLLSATRLADRLQWLDTRWR